MVVCVFVFVRCCSLLCVVELIVVVCVVCLLLCLCGVVVLLCQPFLCIGIAV